MPNRLATADQALANRQVQAAIELFTLAEREGEDADTCAAGRWNCHMLLSDFESAWKESDSIEMRGHADPNRFWDGNSLRGKRVVLRCLHGLGDTIQFLRFARTIKQQAASLVIETQPALKLLIERANQQCTLADHIFTWNEEAPPWDCQIEVNELPRILRISMRDILSTPPYLQQCARLMPKKHHERLRVGLVWAGGDFNPLRSIPLGLLTPLFAVDGIEWFSLQAGQQHADIERCDGALKKICEAYTPIVDIADAMLGLDLMISVDTMTAHLAGSLGCPVWTLLPFASDWRWLLGRDDSPWYPSMRLFRQPEKDAWEPVVEELRVCLGVRQLIG